MRIYRAVDCEPWVASWFQLRRSHERVPTVDDGVEEADISPVFFLPVHESPGIIEPVFDCPVSRVDVSVRERLVPVLPKDGKAVAPPYPVGPKIHEES